MKKTIQKAMLLILAEIVSIISYVGVGLYQALNVLLAIFKRGYKFDPERFDEFEYNLNEYNKNEKTSGVKKILNIVSFFTPGLNLIILGLNQSKSNKVLYEDLKLEDYLIPMTEEEKETFEELTNPLSKILYGFYISQKEEDLSYTQSGPVMNKTNKFYS